MGWFTVEPTTKFSDLRAFVPSWLIVSAMCRWEQLLGDDVEGGVAEGEPAAGRFAEVGVWVAREEVGREGRGDRDEGAGGGDAEPADLALGRDREDRARALGGAIGLEGGLVDRERPLSGAHVEVEGDQG